MFTRAGETWTQQGERIRPEADGTGGVSVALSGDASTALIGDPEENDARVYIRSGETWIEQAEITAGVTGINSEFGRAVALSADGSTALVGAPDDGKVGPVYNRPGSAWVFTRSGGTWTQQPSKLTGPHGALGGAVAVSGDGDEVLMGAAGTPKGGAVAVSERSGRHVDQTQDAEGPERLWR